MESLPEVRAVAGKGLEGDRYFGETGTYSPHPGPHRELTLIELEAIEALARDYETSIDPGAARRNLVTRDVALSHLVGKEFQVGEVPVEGLRLCEPCKHLADLTQARVLPGLVHRGGLRARILQDGVIRVGDTILPKE